MQYTLASVLAFASAALAITVTSPAKGAQWDLSKDNKISWASVSTDPSSLNIVLVNMAVNPPITLTIANNYPVSKGSYDLKDLVNAPAPGDAYQINLENSAQQGILAQSQQFTVEKSSNSNSQSSASSTESTSTGSTLSTSTSTKSSSASASASASASSAAASGSSSASASGSSSSSSASKTSSQSGTSSATGKTSPTASTGAASGNTVFQSTGLGALVMGALVMFA